jgi:hypothetical protein
MITIITTHSFDNSKADNGKEKVTEIREGKKTIEGKYESCT